MSDRYFVAAGSSTERLTAIRDKIEREPGLSTLIDQPGLIVAADRNAPVIRLGDDGIIIGSLHAPGRRGRLDSLSSDVAQTIAAGRGDHLIRAYWGGYVALLRDAATSHIELLRAPLGTLPCLYTRAERTWHIASDIGLLERLGDYRPSVDWDALLRFIATSDARFGETSLRGLSEVRGGDRLTLADDHPGESTLWSPWTFAHRDRQLAAEDATARLRDTILSSIASAEDGLKSVVLLSGGLDSSIVAASAAAKAIDTRCVTVSTNAAAGDERLFARQTAAHVGLPLAERGFDLGAVDLETSAAGHLPRPVARAFEHEGRRQARLEADACGAAGILSGGGGDNIFCSLQSVAPAVDALDGFDDRREFWRVARELSTLTGANLFTVARRAWWRSRQRARQFPRRVDCQFLHPDVVARASDAPRHPCLQRPMSVLQGKGAHVAALLGVQALVEDSDPQDAFGLRFPLLAQPIVELCLRIPTWSWYDRGCNRAVARHAFAQALPAEIAWRRSKGTPDGFVVDIFDAKRAQIREMLTRGNLAGQGLLDLPALNAVLDDPRPVRGTDHGRIMRLVDIEAWTRCWPG